MVGEDWIRNQVIFDPEVGTPVCVWWWEGKSLVNISKIIFSFN